MRRLLPDPADPVDPLEVYAAPRRQPPGSRPWVLLNMVASVDGATAVDGVSGGLGGPPDRAVFRAVRAVADVVLVAAGTVRAEHYRPPRTDEEVTAMRRARGQADRPTLAIVTASVDLDPSLDVFSDPSHPPVVVVPPDAHTRLADRLAALDGRAEILTAGTTAGRVDLGAALAALTPRASVVVAEGGPSLNGQLVAEGLIDELVVTVAPLLVSGDAARLAHGPIVAPPTGLGLDWVLEEDDVLFLRYLTTSAT